MVTKVIIALLLFSQGTMIEHTVTDGGNPCEIDLGNIKVLHEDISKVIQERLLEKENWWDKIPHGPSMGD